MINQVPNYGAMQMTKPPGADKRIAAGICGILLGGLGIHKFILGYTTEGVIMLVGYLAGMILCGVPSIIFAVIGIIEGIMYLTKSDEEFSDLRYWSKKAGFRRQKCSLELLKKKAASFRCRNRQTAQG